VTIGIGYLDGPRLARGFRAAADWVAGSRDELNRINVYPVPDGDTGTNFTLTLRAVADALRALGDAPLPETATTAARAALLGARGNSGMMLAHFLIGFADALGDRPTARTPEVAAAVRSGASSLAQALSEPVEGTMLTVARDSSQVAEREAGTLPDLREFLHRLLSEAEQVLARTPEMMRALRDAGVVDAGGKAFVRMIEGFVRVTDGAPIAAPEPVSAAEEFAAIPAALADVAAERDFAYCTEVLIRGEQFPPLHEVRALLQSFGSSVVVASAGDILKLHVHTDTPESVFTRAEQWGVVTARKAEDMRAQHRRLGHMDRRRVAIVVDSSNDLSDAELDRHRIGVIPMQVLFGTTAYRDRLELKAEEFYRKVRESAEWPTTSQPAPGDMVRAFRAAREEADEVVGILLSSALSGTFAAARAAVATAGIDRVHLVDSRAASLGLGLLALRATELADAGWDAAAIAAELDRVRAQSGMFITVESFENLIRSGRVSRGRAWLGGLLHIRPILEVDTGGRVVALEKVLGQERVLPRVLELLEERLTPRPQAFRLGVVHADAPEMGERIRDELQRFGARDVTLGPATGVLATHVGRGAWAVFYQVEDGTPEHVSG
jgi:DegV family protein with EDD domain